MSSPTQRLFFGLPLVPAAPGELTSAFEKLRAGCAAQNLSPRWTQPEGWHCTLKFIGAAGAELTTSLIEGASLLDLPLPTAAHWRGLGAFPSATQARILVAHLEDDSEHLSELARRCEELAKARGVPVEERIYRPHVTLARLRRPTNLSQLFAELPLAGAVHFGPVTLYVSRSHAGGSRYEPLWSSQRSSE